MGLQVVLAIEKAVSMAEREREIRFEKDSNYIKSNTLPR